MGQSACTRPFCAADACEDDLLLELVGPSSLVQPIEEPLRARLLRTRLEHRFSDCYALGEEVGDGNFGKVYVAEAVGSCQASSTAVPSAQRHRMAVKVYDMALGTSSSFQARQMRMKRLRSCQAEVEMLSRLDHPNIVKMFECFSSDDATHLVLEFCRGGELFTRLAAYSKAHGNGGFPEDYAGTLFAQMCLVVGYLHSHGVTHRDLKPENFLFVDEEAPGTPDVLKLCDFGTAAVGARVGAGGPIGTLSYMAPEVCASRSSGCAADMWSLGVILHLMLTGRSPFRPLGLKTPRQETLQMIAEGYFDVRHPSWLALSGGAQDLVRGLLTVDHSSRLTCPLAASHSWTARRGSESRRAQAVDLEALAQALLQLRLPPPQHDAESRLVARALSSTEADVDGDGGASWRDLFLALDEDGDGCISLAEFQSGFQRLLAEGVEESLEDRFKGLDFDGSGALEWTDFIAAAILCRPGLADEGVRSPVVQRSLGQLAQSRSQSAPENLPAHLDESRIGAVGGLCGAISKL